MLFSLIACDYSDYFNSIGRGGRQLQVPPGSAPSFLPSFQGDFEGLFPGVVASARGGGMGSGSPGPTPGAQAPLLEVPMTHLLYLLCFPAPSRWHPHPLAHRCTWSEAGIFVCAHVCACVHCMPGHTCACICLKIHPFPEQFEQALILLVRPSASPSLIEFNNCSVD